MNYKSIIKSRDTRIKLLNFFDFLPDKQMVQLQYRIKLGRKLNLKNPKRYTEKLQWYKLYYRDPLMARCANKYDVRSFVEEKGLGEILNSCYGVYDSPKDIDFTTLPNSFVLKDTIGGGGNSVIIVKNKFECDWEKICGEMASWTKMSSNSKSAGREWVYENQKHRIIIEANLLDDGENDLPDYKLYCFNGVPFCFHLMENYTQHHEDGVLGFFTPNFEQIPAWRKDFGKMLKQPSKPPKLDEMVEMAKVLSKGFPHVRVDFYNLNGKIVFGEMTFFGGSGYVEFDPDSFDFEMGEKFVLPKPSL